MTLGVSGHGDPTYSLWGGAEWGFFVPTGDVSVLADFLGLDTSEISTLADFLASQDDGVLQVNGDVLALATSTRRVDVDVFVSRIGIQELTKFTTKPLIFVQINFPAGQVFASRECFRWSGVDWRGILLEASEVTRAIGDSVDDFRLSLADADKAIRNGFSPSAPPERSLVKVFLGARDDAQQQLLEVFRGRVEQVVEAVRGQIVLEIVREEAVEDRLVGRLLNQADYPGAPDESVGRMFPILYGFLEEHEGVVTEFNALSELALAVTETTSASLLLQDASRFGSSGSAEIDDETITWTGKLGNELLNVTRGAFGSVPAPHASGARVVEIGTFQVKFADHGLTSLEASSVRILDSDNTPRVPLSLPLVDVSAATATWDRTPRITVPSASSDLITAGFEAVGAANNAGDAIFAARESPSFTDLNYARVDAGETLELQRNTPIEEVGEILRVGLAIAFDPTVPGARVRIGSNVLGALTPADNVPAWALRRLEKHFRTTFDVNDPTHTHSNSSRKIVVRPSIALTGQPWDNGQNAIDGSANTFASYFDSATPPGNVPFVARGAALSINNAETIQSVQLFCWYGGSAGGTFLATGGGIVQLQGLGIAIPTVPVTPTGTSLPTLYAGQPRQGPFTNHPPTWANLDWVFYPNGAGNRRYSLRDMYAELEVSSGVATAPTGLTQRRSFVNFFDVTELVGANWSWFTTVGQKIQVDLSANGTRINTAMWVIETRPRTVTAIEVPRVLCTASGLEPQGRPTEVARTVLTAANPIGLGLSPDVVNQGSYARSAQELAADGVRLDFALHERESGLALLRRLAEQSDLRSFFSSGAHFLVRKPNLSALPGVARSLETCEVLRDSARVGRSSLEVLVTRLETSYRPTRRSGFTRAREDENTSASTQFGTRSEAMELDLVQDSTTAALVAARRLERAAAPRWLVTVDLPLFALELRRGDLVSLTHRDFSFSKGEITSLNLTLAKALVVRAAITVWEE